MADHNVDPLIELKKIAEIMVDRERHRLAAVKDELSRVDRERGALKQQIVNVQGADETDPAALINAQAYLDALSQKSRRLDAERLQASMRTEEQRQKIRTALASKIRIDSMGEK